MAGKAARKAAGEEGESCSLLQASTSRCRARRGARCSSWRQRAGGLGVRTEVHPAELGTAPLAGSWLVFPRLVFQLIALGTGGTMLGCSPCSRLLACSFFPNHFPGPKCWSQDPAATPLGTRGDNGGLLITTSLPFLLNIIPLQTFCRQEPCCSGREGERSRASARERWEHVPKHRQGARGDGGTSPSPTRKVCSKAPDPRGGCPQASGSLACSPSSHLLQK